MYVLVSNVLTFHRSKKQFYCYESLYNKILLIKHIAVFCLIIPLSV